MATSQRKGLPVFWSTAIAKVLVGEQPCYLAPWLAGHHEFDKRVRDQSSLTIWKANHTEQLTAVVERFRAEGWKCDVERFFKVAGQTAIVSGKADLIAQQPNKRPLIVDVKSGQPKESDIAQVALEMITIPMAWNSPDMIFDGQVIYSTHSVNVTRSDADALRPKLFALLKKLAIMPRPEASPSQSSCRFCDVPDEECGSRWIEHAEAATVTTSFF